MAVDKMLVEKCTYVKLNAKIIVTKQQSKTSALYLRIHCCLLLWAAVCLYDSWGKVLVNVELGEASRLIGDVHDF